LGRVSQPRYEINIDSVNYLILPEFSVFTVQTALGSVVIAEINPDEFIEIVQRKFKALQAKYPLVQAGLISTALVSHPKDPEGFINQSQQVMADLKATYPDLSQSVLYNAAVDYS